VNTPIILEPKVKTTKVNAPSMAESMNQRSAARSAARMALRRHCTTASATASRISSSSGMRTPQLTLGASRAASIAHQPTTMMGTGQSHFAAASRAGYTRNNAANAPPNPSAPR
jgi:hypothetical protein